MSAVSTPAEQRVVIENVRWSTYLALLEDSNHRGGRMTFDNGVLEILSPSMTHEHMGRLIGRLVEAFTEELEIDITSIASTTVKLERLQRGFEADEAYYIQRAAQVRGTEELDWAQDPAPDLVIEVGIGRSSVAKLPIYASFRVPEVWRFQGDTLHVYVLLDDHYLEASESKVLPQFPLGQIAQVVSRRTSTSETELIRSFRSWVRQHVAN